MLDVVDGEFIVMVGLFGCGKLMLLWMVVGLECVISGDIWIDCKWVIEMEFKDCGIVMVFQNYVFYFYMSVEENMVWGLKICGMSKVYIEECVWEVVCILELDGLFKCCLCEFFGGQWQCVVMGCVIVCELVVFLFDELFFNFDVKLCVQMCLEL